MFPYHYCILYKLDVSLTSHYFHHKHVKSCCSIDEFLYEMAEVGDVQIKHLTIKMNDEFHKALMLVFIEMHYDMTTKTYTREFNIN